MADLYGTSPSPPPESEELSSFLHQLLHNSSSSSSKLVMPPPPQALNSSTAELLFGCSDGGGGSSLNYSDQCGYFAKESADRKDVSSVENHLIDFYEKGTKAAEVPSETVRPRSSSKRSRAAEVHNLSEKRRRSRINEKMKALQNLIPNSNKTDKASMLDDAIEYLKQLQLQVQMLTMRNGLSLHPMCLPGVLQPMQLPLAGMSIDEGGGLLNTNSATGPFSEKDETAAQTTLNLPNKCIQTNQDVVLPSATKVTSSGTAFGYEPLIQARYEYLNLSNSSKDVCRESTTQAPLESNQNVKITSSGVS